MRTGKKAESNRCNLDQIQLALFVKETLFKMVAFVDVIIVHLDRNTITCENLMANGARALYQKISMLLLVHNALSEALSKVSLLSAANTEIGRIWDKMFVLLFTKDVKACIVMCRTLEKISTRIMELMEDMAATITPQGSSDIHKVTCSAMDHITFLLDNHSTLVPIVSIPPEDDSVWTWLDTLDSKILKMASSLEQKLVSLSKSFSHQGLRFLFLLNNSYFMRERLQYSHLQEFGFRHLTCKVNDYMNSYLDVSWEPVLSCLSDPTVLCLFGKNYSPLSKFETEFQKTYTIHKLWKVPNPELRKSLRIAITEKIIPRYTRYIEDNSVITAKMGPCKLKKMVQELFEG